MAFSDIPVRLNEQTIDSSWFNSIRSELIASDATPGFATFASDAAYITAKGAPASIGDTYYNTALLTIRTYNGTTWESNETQLNKIDGTSLPSVNNDETEGYSVGSFWHDTTNGVSYICMDASTGSAVWQAVITNNANQTMINKNIDASNNTIQNLTTTEFAGATLDTDLSTVSASHDTIPTAKAVEDKYGSHVTSTSGIHGVTGDVVGTTDVQVISGKDFDGATASNTSRLTLPKNTTTGLDALTDKEATLAYDTDLATLVVNNGSSWTEISGSGGGGGGLMPTTNYLQDAGVAAAWTAYANTTAGISPDDFGGTPTGSAFLIQDNTTTPLRGDSTVRLVKNLNVNLQGQGIYTEFTLEDTDLHSILRILGDMSMTSGYSDGAVRLYMVSSSDSFSTDFNVIEPTPTEILAGEYGTIMSEFQTDASDTSYRLCLHVAETATATWIIDYLLACGKSEVAQGPVVTDWQDYTPTFNSGFTVGTGGNPGEWWKFRRVGDSIEIDGGFQLGSTGSMGTGNWSFSLPSGLNVDNSKVQGYNLTAGAYHRIGTAWSFDSTGTSGRSIGEVTRDLVTNNFNVQGRNVTTDTWYQMSATAPFTWGPSDTVNVHTKVPIAGWSSNQVLSSQDDGRACNVYANANSGGTKTASTHNIDWSTTVNDSHAAWNGTQFSAPVSDFYEFDGSCKITTSTALLISTYIDGTIKELANQPNVTTTTHKLKGKVYLEKGQLLSFRPETTVTLSSSVYSHYLYVRRANSGSQQIAASEKCFGSYKADGSTTGSFTTGVDKTIIWDELISDSHGAMNLTTGVGVAPKSGNISFTETHLWDDSGAFSVGEFCFSKFFVNGAEVLRRYREMPSSDAGTYALDHGIVSESYPINKGDTFEIKAYQGSGSSLPIFSSSIYNHFSWEIK